MALQNQMQVESKKFTFCRLCGEENFSGVDLNSKDNEGRTLSNLINQNLPVKVNNDERLPQSICAGCFMQVQSIIEFHQILQVGQKKIKQLFAKEGSSTSKCAQGEDGIPKRKRGRPKKVVLPPSSDTPVDVADVTPVDVADVTLSNSNLGEVVDGKRRRKTPLRYHGAVQGKELEKVLQEEGILDVNQSKNGNSDGEIEDQINEKEVIGRVESLEGADLGEVVLLDKNKNPSQRQFMVFKCEACGKSFNHEHKFLIHQASHQSTELTECQVCHEKFSTLDEFQAHQETTKHDGFNKVNLEQECHCGKGFPSGIELEEHINKEHPKQIECTICQKTFRFNAGLSSHMVQAHPNEDFGFPCDICGKKLKHPQSLPYHKQTEHNVQRKYSCSKCDKTFRHRLLLLRHQLVHSEDRPYKCNICDARFKSRPNLSHHSVVHSEEKKFKCDLCGLTFSHHSSLKIHTKWHSGFKPYECEYCGKSFHQKGNLQEHIRTHTNEKPFMCEYCDRTFKTSSQCKTHIKSHVGEKIWKCSYCGKNFLSKFSLVNHMRRHTGKRPYACNICSKDFLDLNALKKHLRFHTGEKPYKCVICNRAFSDNSNMIKHRNNTHLKRIELEKALQQADQTNPSLDIWNVIKPEEASLNKDKDVNLQQIFFISCPDTENQEAKGEELLYKELKDDQEDDRNQLNQMHLMDEQGNLLSFTTQEGAIVQLTTDGENLQLTMSDGNSIPVQLTSTDDENVAQTIQTVMLPTIEEENVDQNVQALGFVTDQEDSRLILNEATLDFLPLA